MSTQIGGQTHVASQYQIPYEKFEAYINGIDPKAMKMMSALDMMRKSFEFGYMLVALDREDMMGRIANLNEQNLKWFKKADEMEAECTVLRKRLAEISGAPEQTSKNLASSNDLKTDLSASSEASESSPKRPEALEDSQISTDATKEVISN